ncbi:hypothetical protein Patl1_35790 [Pistacia atlantica]|nr:hypothetical protein Patl1_35790 [Pistacia atlantica]
MQKGFRLEFADNKCEIKDPSGVEFMCVPMKNRSFVVNWSSMDVKAFSSREENKSLLWHKRLGHFNLNSIKIAVDKNMVKDVPTIGVLLVYISVCPRNHSCCRFQSILSCIYIYHK